MKDKLQTIGIIGAGQMGSGMIYLVGCYKENVSVKIWNRSIEVLNSIRELGESPHLPGYQLPEEINICTGIKELLRGIDLLVLAIPSFAIREICQRIADSGSSLPPILMVSKGMEKDTSKLPFQIVQEILGQNQILHLTGLGYPKELKKEKKVNEVLAVSNEELFEKFGDLFETHFIRIEKSTDLLGVQLAGALKNVMVIAIGMVWASQKNYQIKEFLISLAVKEMKKLGRVMGAREETFDGPAGQGDLEFSANPLSRNFALGEAIFQKGIKEPIKEIEGKKTIEGIHTAFAVHNLAEKYSLSLPISESVYQLIYKGVDCKKNIQSLLNLVFNR